MSFTRLEAHTANVKLQLTETTGYVSHFITIWKGRPLLVSFNHLTEEIFNLYYLEMLDSEEVVFIESIIKEYLNYK